MGSGFGRSLQIGVPEVRHLSTHSTEVNRRDGMPFTHLQIGGMGYID